MKKILVLLIVMIVSSCSFFHDYEPDYRFSYFQLGYAMGSSAAIKVLKDADSNFTFRDQWKIDSAYMTNKILLSKRIPTNYSK